MAIPCPTPAAPAVKPNNRILIVDDNLSIHADFRKILCADSSREAALDDFEQSLFSLPAEAAKRPVYVIDSAQQGEQALAMVKEACQRGQPYAMTFMDVRMPPGMDGIETAARVWQIDPDMQIVLCTAYSDYSWDEMIAKLSYSDRLVILKKPFDAVEVLQLAAALTAKHRLTQESHGRIHSLEAKVAERTQILQRTNEHLQQQILERQQAVEALQESEERYLLLFQENPLPMWVADASTMGILAVNNAAVSGYGYTRAEMLGMKLPDLHCPEEIPALKQRFASDNFDLPVDGLVSRHRKKDGGIIVVEISCRCIQFSGRTAKLVLANDITERKKLETQFLRAQRIEGIGTLATGMAHDLNNILSPILISAGTLRWGLTPDEQEKAISRIEVSVKRGAGIIQQVLTFGRGMAGDHSVLHVGEILEEITRISTRTFPKNITITTQVEKGLWATMGDRTQIHQVLLNLCVNARDAMPNGGKLSLRARNVTLTETRSALPTPAAPGPYLLLQVSDTGSGISTAVRERIFDPFFTTKEVGKGTGLGLSTVLGIVKSHQGTVTVESEPGQGTTFRVLLPAQAEAVKRTAAYVPPELPRGHGEAVLLVDDEPEIVAGVQEMLEKQNYRVLTACNGVEALAIMERHGAAISAVVTDIMMPEMDGVGLIRALRQHHPGLQIVASSGLGTERGGSLRSAELEALRVTIFLNKPYAADQLLVALNRLLRKSQPECTVSV